MNPSYQHYATHDESEYPELWDRCVGAWAPCLGPTGTRLHDNSGKANWGEQINMGEGGTWVVDAGKYALDFDGGNDFVLIDREIISNGHFSLSFWVQFKALPSVAYFLVNRAGTGELDDINIFLNAAGLLRFGARASDASFPLADFAFAPTLGRWYHVGATYDGTNSLWINGRKVATSASYVRASSPYEFWRFAAGSAAGSVRFFANVRISEVMFHSRAVSFGEMSLLANSPGIAYTPRRRRKAYFLGPSFNAAWARGANQFIQPSMIGVA